MSKIVDKRFYVLRVVSGKEIKVKERVEAEFGDSVLGLSVFNVIVPMEKIATQREGKRGVKERPLMPGYVLVEAVLDSDTEFRLRQIQDVLGFLGSRAGRPEPMRQSEVEAILRRMDDEAEGKGEYRVDVLVGDHVRVVDGSFKGVEGVVDVVNAKKQQLTVIVRMLGRNTPLELSYAQVSKI